MTKRRIAGVVLAGLLLVGCGDTDSGIPNQDIPNINVNNNQPVVVNPPVAGSFSFSTSLGAQVVRTAANGLLSVGTPNGATVVTVQSPTTLGGTITANADGSFTYNPPAQVGVTDSFTYTIQNSAGNSTGTANVSLILPRFFVNNQAAAGGDGSQAAPFQTLAQAQTAATGINGAEIVVFQGDGTSNGYNTALALGGNQTLRGFSQAARPVLTGPVRCVGGNRLEDLSFANNTALVDVVNGSNSTGGVVNRVSFSNVWSACTTTNSSGNWSITNSTFDNITVTAVSSASVVGDVNFTVDNCTFQSSSAGVGWFVQGTTRGSYKVANSTFLGSWINLVASTQGTNLDVTVANCRVDGSQGTVGRGINLGFGTTTTSTARLTNNNVTACILQDVNIDTFNSSVVRALVEGNRVQGGSALLQQTSEDSSTFCGVYKNNIFDSVSIRRLETSIVQIEDFANFGTVNAGTLSTQGTITDVPLGTCGF